MLSSKRILRQENGVVLIETAFRDGFSSTPSNVTYCVYSKGSPRILSFDDLASANDYFEEELTRCDRLRLATGAVWRVSG